MKCKYCGGNITLETEYCPYCGKTNEHAQKHAADMKTYQRVYESTRNGVQDAAHKYTGATIRLIIIAVLVIMIVVLFILGAKSYDFRRMWIEHRSEKNSKQNMETMDEYLENEEFLAFTAFCEENYIYTYDTVFEKYTPAERVSRYYRYVYEDIMRIACPPEYADQEFVLESLSENLEYFYTSMDMKEYEYYDIDTELNQRAIAAMEEKTELLLHVYCGLTEEEAMSMRTMSKAKRAVMLEEAVLDE